MGKETETRTSPSPARGGDAVVRTKASELKPVHTKTSVEELEKQKLKIEKELAAKKTLDAATALPVGDHDELPDFDAELDAAEEKRLADLETDHCHTLSRPWKVSGPRLPGTPLGTAPPIIDPPDTGGASASRPLLTLPKKREQGGRSPPDSRDVRMDSESPRSDTVSPRTLRELKKDLAALRQESRDDHGAVMTQLDRQGIALSSNIAYTAQVAAERPVRAFWVKPKGVSVETLRSESMAAFKDYHRRGLASNVNEFKRPCSFWLTAGNVWSVVKKDARHLAPSLKLVLCSPSNTEQQEQQARQLRVAIEKQAKVQRGVVLVLWPQPKDDRFDQRDDWSLAILSENDGAHHAFVTAEYNHSRFVVELKCDRRGLAELNMGDHEFKAAWASVSECYESAIEFVETDLPLLGNQKELTKGRGKGKVTPDAPSPRQPAEAPQMVPPQQVDVASMDGTALLALATSSPPTHGTASARKVLDKRRKEMDSLSMEENNWRALEQKRLAEGRAREREAARGGYDRFPRERQDRQREKTLRERQLEARDRQEQNAREGAGYSESEMYDSEPASVGIERARQDRERQSRESWKKYGYASYADSYPLPINTYSSNRGGRGDRGGRHSGGGRNNRGGRTYTAAGGSGGRYSR